MAALEKVGEDHLHSPVVHSLIPSPNRPLHYKFILRALHLPPLRSSYRREILRHHGLWIGAFENTLPLVRNNRMKWEQWSGPTDHPGTQLDYQTSDEPQRAQRTDMHKKGVLPLNRGSQAKAKLKAGFEWGEGQAGFESERGSTITRRIHNPSSKNHFPLTKGNVNAFNNLYYLWVVQHDTVISSIPLTTGVWGYFRA